MMTFMRIILTTLHAETRHRRTEPKTFFKQNVFEKSLNEAISQIAIRFKGMNEICEWFEVFFPKKLLLFEESDIVTKVERLIEQYPKDFDSSTSLINQLRQIKLNFSENLKAMANTREFLAFLLIEQNSLGVCFPDLISALVLFLTLPVTVASAERSFSKLKIIKNYMRSSIGQDRLSGLAMISIEGSRAKSLQTSEVIAWLRKVKNRCFFFF
jgi:hypothetical protein